MVVKTRTALKTLLETTLADNTDGAIIPGHVRQIAIDTIDSAVWNGDATTISDDSVSSAALQASSVGTSELQSASVSTEVLQDGSVTAAKLASDVSVGGGGGGGGGTPAIIVNDNFVQLGAATDAGTQANDNINLNPNSGLLGEATLVSLSDSVATMPLRYDNTLPGFNLPTGATYDDATGSLVLPAGHWIVTATMSAFPLSYRTTTSVSYPNTTTRSYTNLAIWYGDDKRYAQSHFNRVNTSPDDATPSDTSAFFNVGGLFQTSADLIVTGPVISDGVTAVVVRVGLTVQDLSSSSVGVELRLGNTRMHAYKLAPAVDVALAPTTTPFALVTGRKTFRLKYQTSDLGLASASILYPVNRDNGAIIDILGNYTYPRALAWNPAPRYQAGADIPITFSATRPPDMDTHLDALSDETNHRITLGSWEEGCTFTGLSGRIRLSIQDAYNGFTSIAYSLVKVESGVDDVIVFTNSGTYAPSGEDITNLGTSVQSGVNVFQDIDVEPTDIYRILFDSTAGFAFRANLVIEKLADNTVV